MIVVEMGHAPPCESATGHLDGQAAQDQGPECVVIVPYQLSFGGQHCEWWRRALFTVNLH